MTMQDIQFFTSYQDEIIQTGKPPAPRIQVALTGQRLPSLSPSPPSPGRTTSSPAETR